MTAHYTNEGRQAGLIVVPTGGGKTVLAAHWLLEHHIRNGGRVLWLAHRCTLLRQAMNTFRNLGNVAFPKSAMHLATVSSTDARWATISREHDVVFSSMQTAVLEGNGGFVQEYVNEGTNGVFVVVDEAHHAPASGSARLLRSLKGWGCKVLGLTATPVRANDEDEKRLAALFDKKVIYQVTRRELTEKGILAAPAFETVKTEVNLEKDFTPEDYKHLERYGEIGPQVLHRLAKNAHRNALIVEHYKQKKDVYGPTIVFAADTLHAQTLSEEFKKSGIDADHVDYSRKDAQEVIERYRAKRKPDVLVNVEMLTEGFDAPHTRTVFIARPTQSEGLLSQMVGRALRGKQSGGNDVAHLVTFLDTWEQFNVLDAEYVLSEAEDIEKETAAASDSQLVAIPIELVREAYRLLQSNVRGQFTGVFQCLPHSWYAWNETFEDDHQHRSVMLFDNQVAGFEALLAAYRAIDSIPAAITEDVARALVQKFFADVPDPLPRWADVKALLDAKRKGCDVDHYTFEDKNAFDPQTLAQQILEKKMTRQEEQDFLQEVWAQKPACRGVYRDDTRTRKSLIEPVLTPLTPGVDPAPVDSFQIEQWIAAPTQYGIPIDTHLPSSAVAIVNKFLEDFDSLIQNAAWTMNRLPRNAFYRAYCGGQTLTMEASAAVTTVKVAALSGFRYVLGPDGKLAQVSAGTPLNVTVDGVDNTVTGAVPLDPRFPDGPGTLSLGTAVTVAARKAVLATNRPFVMRPGGENSIDALTGTSVLTSTMLVNSVARMRANRVPTFSDGLYHCHLDPIQLAQLFQDQAFQRLYQASPRAPEFVIRSHAAIW